LNIKIQDLKFIEISILDSLSSHVTSDNSGGLSFALYTVQLL